MVRLREDTLTKRRRIAQMLRDGECTVRDMSQELGIREKEVYEHLPHVERSFGSGVSLISRPAECLHCGFVFKKRTRFTAPGKCPVCRSEAISPPVYGIKASPRKVQTFITPGTKIEK